MQKSSFVFVVLYNRLARFLKSLARVFWKTWRELDKHWGAHFPKTVMWFRWKLWRARACQKLLRVPMKTMARAIKNYGVFCHKTGYVKRFYCLLSCVIKKIINFAMCGPSCAPTKTLNLIQTAAWSRTSVFYHLMTYRYDKEKKICTYWLKFTYS